jgi:hypothetical protein
VEEGKNQQR